MRLDTNQGFNALAVLIPITTAVIEMPDGPWKWALLVILSLGAVIVGIKTKGDNPAEIDEHADIGDVLKKGRD
jgi:hypothetical protein